MEHTSALGQWQRSVPPCPGEQPSRSQRLRVSSTKHGSLSGKQIHNPSAAESALCLAGIKKSNTVANEKANDYFKQAILYIYSIYT